MSVLHRNLEEFVILLATLFVLILDKIVVGAAVTHFKAEITNYHTEQNIVFIVYVPN